MSTVIGLVIGGLGATFLSASFPEIAIQVHNGLVTVSQKAIELAGAYV